MGTALHYFAGCRCRSYVIVSEDVYACPTDHCASFPVLVRRNDAHQNFWKTYQTPQRDKMKPASHWLVPDKETSLVNHLQQIRLNPSEIILPAI